MHCLVSLGVKKWFETRGEIIRDLLKVIWRINKWAKSTNTRVVPAGRI